MIEKWYCLRCDNCGEIINYWETSSAEKAIHKEKELDVCRITKAVNGENGGWKILCPACIPIKRTRKEYMRDYYLEKIKPARKRRES